MDVIGGSKFTAGPTVEILVRPIEVAKSGKWSATFFVLAAALLFGGAAGNWFSIELAGESFALRALQLSAGAIGMGAIVSVFGSLFFGRNPIRWGMGMPLLVYIGGTLLALVSGREGAITLLYGSPLFLGLSFAAGVTSAFFVEAVFARGQRD